jgi:hypothetical protein
VRLIKESTLQTYLTRNFASKSQLNSCGFMNPLAESYSQVKMMTGTIVDVANISSSAFQLWDKVLFPSVCHNILWQLKQIHNPFVYSQNI